MIPLIVAAIFFLLGLSIVIFSRQLVKRNHHLRLKNNRRSNKGLMQGNPNSERIQLILWGVIIMAISGYYFYHFFMTI